LTTQREPRTLASLPVVERGEFAFGGVGGTFEAPKCSLRIEKLGLTAQTVRTTDVCYRGTETGNSTVACKPGEGKITLVP
jgi:hypothetical protein